MSVLNSIFSDQSQNTLLKHGKYLKLSRGTVLQKQDEEMAHFYIVLSGILKLSRCIPSSTRAGVSEKTHLMDLVTEGHSIGIALMTAEVKQLSPIEIKCLAESEVLEFTHDFYFNHWKYNPELFNYGTLQIQKRLLKFQDDICFRHLPLAERLAHFLTDGIYSLQKLQLTRRDIAECMDVSTETIIRILSVWTSEQLIRTEKRHIQIIDPVKLRNLWKKQS